jgi:hypothetical protein
VNYRKTQSFTMAKRCRLHFRYGLVASPHNAATRPSPALKADRIGLPAFIGDHEAIRKTNRKSDLRSLDIPEVLARRLTYTEVI